MDRVQIAAAARVSLQYHVVHLLMLVGCWDLGMPRLQLSQRWRRGQNLLDEAAVCPDPDSAISNV